jgi:hypothetical protein
MLEATLTQSTWLVYLKASSPRLRSLEGGKSRGSVERKEIFLSHHSRGLQYIIPAKLAYISYIRLCIFSPTEQLMTYERSRLSFYPREIPMELFAIL